MSIGVDSLDIEGAATGKRNSTRLNSTWPSPAFAMVVLGGWLVLGLILASRIPTRWDGPWTPYLQLLVLLLVIALGAATWGVSALALARARQLPFPLALRADGSTYLGLGLGLPCLAGVLPAGISLGISALACGTAKGLLWRAPTWWIRWGWGDALPYFGLAMVALLFSLPNVFSTRAILPTLSSTLSSRDLPYEEKMAEKWPDLYPLTQFVRANTPADATVELPPLVKGLMASPLGQAALSYYFLRPRVLVQGPAGLERSAFPRAYTVVAYGRFLPGSQERVIWPRELPAGRRHLAMPQVISLYLDHLVGTGPGGEFLRLDFERARETALSRLRSDTRSTVMEHRIVERGHEGRRSEKMRVEYESGSVDEWGFAMDETIVPGQRLQALVLATSEASARLFAEVRLQSGSTLRLYSEPNSLERWWDVLMIDDLEERVTAVAGDPSVGEEARLTLVGLQILPHLARWGLIMPAEGR